MSSTTETSALTELAWANVGEPGANGVTEPILNKKKYRRSMLGQRTKLYNMDSDLNLSKALQYDESETVQIKKSELETCVAKENVNNYLSNEMPNGITTMNPLYTSPNNKSKKKYRRSMLGQRTKLYNMDSALNITKTLQYDESETGQTNQMKLETSVAKQNVHCSETNPFYTSSSNSEKHRQPTTPPNPFGYEESVSKFFESEINDMGAWSVFKTKQNGIKTPSLCSTGGKSLNKSTKSVSEVPAKTSVRKHFKTKLFDRDEDSVVSDKRNEERLQATLIGTSVLDIKSNKYKSRPCTRQSILSSKPKSPKLSPVQDETVRDLDSDAPTSDIDNIDLSNKCTENNFTSSMQNNDEENSDDSFSLAESTIIDSIMLTSTASKERSASKAPKLSIICEENDKINEKYDKYADQSDSLDKSSVDSQEQVSIDYSECFKQDFEQLYKLYESIKVYSEATDKMLENFLKEKKIRDNYFKMMEKKMDEIRVKYFENNPDTFSRTLINTNGINNKLRKKKLKGKQSNAVFMLSPENAFSSPKRKQSPILKSYSELRKGFSYLKTPEQSSKKKKSARSSICYTPKSLSSCIEEQLKSLHS